MATIVTTKRTFDGTNTQIQYNLPTTCLSVNTNEFLFYSNNPESVYYKDFADSGKFFCRETVKGNGQIYTWHRNEYEGTVTSLI